MRSPYGVPFIGATISGYTTELGSRFSNALRGRSCTTLGTRIEFT
jgi:hypothetical protein